MVTTTPPKITQKTPVKKAAPKTVQKTKASAREKQTKTSNTKKPTAPPMGGFSVIETGGKQYKVSSGDTIKVEKLPGTYKEGAKIVFDKVLLVADGKSVKIGTPYVSGAKIEAIFEEEGKSKKISIVKFKSKSRYLRKGGHRQIYTKIKIR